MELCRLGCVATTVANTGHLGPRIAPRRAVSRSVLAATRLHRHQRGKLLGSRSFFGFNLGNLLPSNGSRVSGSVWLDSSAQVDVDAPLSVAWELWSDRERINRWMPWISSIKVLKDKPALSKWTLRSEAFGQHLEFSWMAENLEPIHHQKIHWMSVDGLPNRGAVRFYPKGPSACRVQLTISYEVPELLQPVAAAVGPFLEGVLQRDMNRFAELAARQHALRQPANKV